MKIYCIGEGSRNWDWVFTQNQFRAIARTMQTHAPDAFIVNYTNPMTIRTRTLYKEFPQTKASGCCHEVFNSQKLLNNISKPVDARRKCLPLEDARNLLNKITRKHYGTE